MENKRKILKFIEEVRMHKDVITPNVGSAVVLSTPLKVANKITIKAETEKAILLEVESRTERFIARTNEFIADNPRTHEVWVAKSLIGEETDTYIEIEGWFCDQKKYQHIFYHLVPAQERYITFKVKTVEEFEQLRSLMAQKIK